MATVKSQVKISKRPKKLSFPVPNVIYSIASKGAGWFHYQFNTGENKRKLEEIRKGLDGDTNRHD